MPQEYELGLMLEEILEDEKAGKAVNVRLSQAEIARMLVDRQRATAKKVNGLHVHLGEDLLKQGLITAEQLKNALVLQSQKGGKIGSLLVELGYITPEALLHVLGDHFGIESVDLLKSDASEMATSLLPLKVMLKHRVIPIKATGRSIRLAMENPNSIGAIHDVEFITGKRVEPVVIPAYQMNAAMKSLEENRGSVSFSTELQFTDKMAVTLKRILQYFVSTTGSDMLISAGVPPSVKLQNMVERADMPSITSQQCVLFAKSLMTEQQWEDFLKNKELDFAVEYDELGRFRVNVYRQRDTISIAFRRVMSTIPSLDSLGLPLWLEDIALKPHGMVIFAAPTGHGKTTSLHAMVDIINSNRKCNIISMEDPVEYVHVPKKSNINQREIGRDTHSFSEGLKRIFRQSPDVIVVGEIRDTETIEIAAKAASSGHLVLSTLHALNATAALEAMVNYFPIQQQSRARQQLAEALLLVFSQRLIPRKGTKSLTVAYEKLVNSYRIKNLIREGKEHQIRAQIQQDAEDFSSMDVCLMRLLKEGKISKADAVAFADNAEYVSKAAN